MISESGLLSALPILGLTVSGECDEPYPVKPRKSLDPPRYLVAVQFRQPEIKEYDVRLQGF